MCMLAFRILETDLTAEASGQAQSGGKVPKRPKTELESWWHWCFRYQWLR